LLYCIIGTKIHKLDPDPDPDTLPEEAYQDVRSGILSVRHIDISQYIDGFWALSLLYTDRVPFDLLDSAALLYEGRELRWRGSNSVSKFDHHNINGNVVDDT
jgi:hypothetical protein